MEVGILVEEQTVLAFVQKEGLDFGIEGTRRWIQTHSHPIRAIECNQPWFLVRNGGLLNCRGDTDLQNTFASYIRENQQ